MTFAVFNCLLFAAALRAQEPIEVQWNDICRITSGKEINLHTAAGTQLKGYCISVSVDEMSIRTTDGRVMKIARNALQKLRMQRVKGGQLKALGKGVNGAFLLSTEFLFSPAAPIGLVGIPASLAWGVVAAPFCVLGDLHSKLHGSREIRVM